MSDEQPIAINRRAFHDYFIEERYHAGISLVGTEVKSLREGKANLQDSFARIEKGEVFLYNAHVASYRYGNRCNHDPTRTRKLLFKRAEIERLFGRTQRRGFTLIPLKIYFSHGWVKVELALARGKKLYDKRETMARKSSEREIRKTLKERNRTVRP